MDSKSLIMEFQQGGRKAIFQGQVRGVSSYRCAETRRPG